MTYSKDATNLIEQFESCRYTAYQDSGGIWTIGYGHTWEVKPGDTMSIAEAEKWLIFDIGYTVACLNAHIKVEVTQAEFDALVDFAFNIGVGNFCRSTLLAVLNEGNFSAAEAEFDKWDNVSGQVVQGLFRRREAERKLFDART